MPIILLVVLNTNHFLRFCYVSDLSTTPRWRAFNGFLAHQTTFWLHMPAASSTSTMSGCHVVLRRRSTSSLNQAQVILFTPAVQRALALRSTGGLLMDPAPYIVSLFHHVHTFSQLLVPTDSFGSSTTTEWNWLEQWRVILVDLDALHGLQMDDI